MANCFMVASSAVWLPEKYPATALWKRRSCFCITWTCLQSRKIFKIIFLPLLCSRPRISTWSEHQSGAFQTPPSCCWSWPGSLPASAGSPGTERHDIYMLSGFQMGVVQICDVGVLYKRTQGIEFITWIVSSTNICFSYKHGHQMAPLALFSNLANMLCQFY